MASLKERVSATVERLRERLPLVDHAVRMLQHYGTVNGNGQAGAVTFFGFLSFFPILALGFFVVGLLAHLYPDIKPQMVSELNEIGVGVMPRKLLRQIRREVLLFRFRNARDRDVFDQQMRRERHDAP